MYLEYQTQREQSVTDEHAPKTMQMKSPPSQPLYQQHANKRHEQVNPGQTYTGDLCLVYIQVSVLEYRRRVKYNLQTEKGRQLFI